MYLGLRLNGDRLSWIQAYPEQKYIILNYDMISRTIKAGENSSGKKNAGGRNSDIQVLKSTRIVHVNFYGFYFLCQHFKKLTI